jgi:hypothetical protein
VIAAHQVEQQLAHWQSKLPAAVAVPTRTAPVTRDAFLRVVRAELLPFITYGPGYERPVAEELRRALDMYIRDRGEEFSHWLGEALRAAARARARTAEPFDPQAVLVAATEWSVSYTAGSGIDGAILKVHDVDQTAQNEWGGMGVSVHHPVYDGLRFSSVTDAREFAYNAGLLKRHAAAQA